jgi:hypothetical protein
VETPAEYSKSVITKEVSAKNTEGIKESPSNTLQEMDEAFETPTYLLSLYNIYQIIRIIETSRNQIEMLNKAFEIISDDITRRNKLYRTDCVKELYQGDDSLPEEQQLRRPSRFELLGQINQSLKAIILHEYKRLHSHCGQQFINNQITYETYIQTTDRFSTYADKLFSELPA